jgi:hypothetical protein
MRCSRAVERQVLGAYHTESEHHADCAERLPSRLDGLHYKHIAVLRCSIIGHSLRGRVLSRIRARWHSVYAGRPVSIAYCQRCLRYLKGIRRALVFACRQVHGVRSEVWHCTLCQPSHQSATRTATHTNASQNDGHAFDSNRSALVASGSRASASRISRFAGCAISVYMAGTRQRSRGGGPSNGLRTWCCISWTDGSLRCLRCAGEGRHRCALVVMVCGAICAACMSPGVIRDAMLARTHS